MVIVFVSDSETKIMDINYFAQLNYRGRDDKFGIKVEDLSRHMYIIGKTGMGKTVMLQNMAVQDILSGRGVGIIDPHGEFSEGVLDFVPKDRIKDVVYFNPADYEHPIGLNLLEDVGYNQRHLVASGLMGVFKKIWVDVWSARMEYILNNTILALLEYPDATLLDVNRMMANKIFRKEVLEYVKDPIVKAFWTEEFAKYTDRLASEATSAIQNKIGQFTVAPLIRNIVGQKKSTIDMRKIMDEGKIFIMNLSKGRIGEENSRLLGAMAITKLYLSAMSRIDIPEDQRRNFILYVDEFQNFASEAFEGILSEARKYKLSLVLAHQYIAQMEEGVREAVFGNIGTFVTFRVGAEDAEYIEKEFAPDFSVEDLVNIPRFGTILKLMIDGVTSRAFSARTLPPFRTLHESYREEIIKTSREQFSTPRQEMEDRIAQWNTDTTQTHQNQNQSSARQNTRSQSRPQYNKPAPKIQSRPQHDQPKPVNKADSNPAEKESISLKEAHKKYPPKKKNPKRAPMPSYLNKKKPEVDTKGLRDLLDEVEKSKEQN